MNRPTDLPEHDAAPQASDLALQQRIAALEAAAAEQDALIRELRHSNAALEIAISCAHLGTWDWYPAEEALIWSADSKIIFGLAGNEELTFDRFLSFIYPDDRDAVLTEIETKLKTGSGKPYDVMFRIIRANDQAVRWVRARGQAVGNDPGVRERFIGTVLDITERKLAQEKILQSEKLFKSIALNLPKSLMIVIDPGHRFLLVEGDMAQVMGYDSRDYVGKHIAEVTSAERYEASKDLYNRMLAGEQFSVARKAATGADYMIHFTPLKHDHDEVYAGLIIALDISDVKAAGEKSAKLAAIVDSSDDAIVSKSLEGIVTSWNLSAMRMFGYSEAEMIGQPILKLIPPDRQDEEPRILSRLRSGERIEHFETKRMTKSGALLDVSLTISPVRDVDGKIIGLSKIARDITSRKQEEQRKADFISMVSHELKTPLTSITAYVQLLLARAGEVEDAFSSNALSKTETLLRKMNNMISDFLNMARIDDGKMPLHKTTFDLGSLIEEVAADAQFLTQKHQIHIASGAKVSVHADRDKIGLVLINLLSNAVKYSPQGGNVHISAIPGDSEVRIAIQDEGVGISATDQKRLFERFYRVSNDKIKTVSGFGIGLYLAAEILGYHGSTIEVESEEGKGSLFSFNLRQA